MEEKTVKKITFLRIKDTVHVGKEHAMKQETG